MDDRIYKYRSSMPYSLTEEAMIEKLLAEKTPLGVIAEKLGRSVRAIESKSGKVRRKLADERARAALDAVDWADVHRRKTECGTTLKVIHRELAPEAMYNSFLVRYRKYRFEQDQSDDQSLTGKLDRFMPVIHSDKGWGHCRYGRY